MEEAIRARFAPFTDFPILFISALNKQRILKVIETAQHVYDTVSYTHLDVYKRQDVDWVAKVKMQGRIQQWVDHSISVTINLPSDISQEMVATLYVEAWKACLLYTSRCV